MTGAVVTAPRTQPRRRTPIVVAVAAVAAVAAIGLLAWQLWPSPPSAAVLNTRTSGYWLSATVERPRIGTTDVTVTLTGRGATTPAVVTLEAVMPLMGVATPPIAATDSGGGHYLASGVPLMMTGPWELHVAIGGGGGPSDVTLPFTVTG